MEHWAVFAKYSIIAFGVFIILAGFLMLFNPKKARAILKKAGSTNLINYGELVIRMIPAAALVYYSGFSKSPEFFKFLGWVMLITSTVLLILPRRLHHAYSLKAAEILKPLYFQFISPLAFFFGGFLIYASI